MDGGIVEYERCESSHIELLENGAYCYCALAHDPEQSLADYLAYAEAARIAVATVREWLAAHDTDLVVVFNVFSAEDEAYYRTQLGL